ncbi:gamma-glutamyltranspeptidase [Lentinula raphanica]|nr:gamma-glutamyltranspeptidase [Lentinula raphanica]
MNKPSHPHGAVTCELKSASAIGAQILLDGGSAADAIIATTLAVGTVASYHSGIGGGGFAIVRQPDGGYRSIDFRSAAPAALTSAMFIGKPEATGIGGLSVAVPGELRGFEELHRRYGRLPWKRLFQPSIELARDGFPFTEDLMRLIRTNTLPKATSDLSHSWILKHPILREMYTKDGSFLPIGSILTRPKLAHALELIAENGADVFYNGQLAKDLIDSVAAEGGVMTLDDLKNYRVRETQPLSIDYKGKYKITSPSAPASGGVFLLALNVLSNYTGIGGPDTVEDSHMMIESLKFAYAQRTLLGDPNFVHDLEAAQDEWTKSEVGRDLYSRILHDSTLPSELCCSILFYLGARSDNTVKPDHGTSNIVAVDSGGLVISITTTITLWWGSRIVVPSSEIVLNDSIEDFSVEGKHYYVCLLLCQSNHFGYLPTPANYVEGNKRPLSSSSPFIIEDSEGRFRYAGGAAGGSRIISCNVQQARNFMDYGMDPLQALSYHRLHDQIAPNETHLEEGLVNGEVAAALEKMGHKIKWLPRAGSVGCAISYDPEIDLYQAEGEPRLAESGGQVI